MARLKLTYKENKAFYKNLEKKFIEDFEVEIDRTITDIEAEASARVPVDTGFLRSKINGEVKGLEGVVRVNATYAPFVEFGTGGLADVPEGLEDYADDFRSKTPVRQINLTPRPYLYPAFFSNTQKMFERLEEKINGSKQSN